MVNITILGAGALGVYFGGRLQEKGESVTFLVREQRANQIAKNGLKIESVHGNYIFPEVQLALNPKEIEEVDLVILSVKGYHLNGTLPHLHTLVEKGAKVLPLLNGIEHISILQEVLGAENVIGGLSFIMATLDEKGHVLHNSAQHQITFGPLHESQNEFCSQLEGIFSGANMGYENSQKILNALWEKYMFITALSGITSAVNSPIGIIRSHRETLDVGITLLHEMKALANQYGAELTEESVEKANALIHSFPDEGTSSMHQDKRKGLPLELDHLHGAALRMAERVGLQLPTLSVIYALIKPFEKGNVR